MSLSTTFGKSLYWKLLQFLIVFVINVLFVRLFKPELSSVFYSIIYLSSLLVSLFTFGMDVSLNYFLSKKQISASDVHSITILMLIVALLVSTPVSYFYFTHTPLNHFISVPEKTAFSLLFIVGGLLIVFSSTIFTVNNQNHIPLKVSVLLSVLLLTLCTALKIKYSSSSVIDTFFYCYFVVYFFTGVLLFFWSIKLYNKGFKLQFDFPISFHQIFRYSFLIFFINILFVLASKVSIFILPYWLDAQILGNYIQAYKIVEYIVTFISFIYYPAISIVAGQLKEESRGLILYLIRLSNTVILFISLIALLVGKYLFTTVFGLEFNLMFEIFVYLIPGLFALCASTFFTAYYFGSNLLKYNLISACIMLIILLVGLFLFARDGDAASAALVFSLAAIAGFIYDAVSFRHIQHFKLQDILFLKSSDLSILLRTLKLR